MERLEEFGSDANEAIRMALALPSAPSESLCTFHPSFTYSLFGENEVIYGYKGLEVLLKFASDDMTPMITAKWKEKARPVGDTVPEDPVAMLQEFLPKDVCLSEDDFVKRVSQRDYKTFAPPGELINTYEHNGKSFEIWKAKFSDHSCKELLGNFQVMVQFYIEGGNPIPLDEEEWASNRWDVFFLYERRPDFQYVFVGYCTVHQFYFFDKLLKTTDLTRARISQFIVIPPYQKQGHGSRFYDEIMSSYLNNKHVQEITVEDPSEQFEEIRIRRDVARLKANGTFNDITVQDVANNTVDLEKLRKENKLPERQFLTCMEIALLETFSTKDKINEARYRLWVKTRIYKQNKDTLIQMDKSERIERLDTTYNDLIELYKVYLKKMKSRKAEEFELEEKEKNRPAKRVKVA